MTLKEKLTQASLAAVDKVLGRVISRKLLVWLAATVMMIFTDSLSSGDWVNLSLVYIGTQGAIDAVKKWKEKL